MMGYEADWLPRIEIVQVADCPAEPARIRAMGAFARDVRDVLPYLAALLPQAGYSDATGILSLVREGRLITVYPHVVNVAKARDEDDAAVVLEWLRGRLNEAYARQEELTPCYERRRTPRLLDVYRLLPGGNCRRCGEATCMAFAGRLAFDQARPADCPRLSEPAFARNRQVLADWLGVRDFEAPTSG